jgi:phytoene dehydrogenase-like protein
VVHLADTLPSIFRSHQEAGAGRAPSEPTLVVGQHTVHDPSRAPEGRHTLYVYTHVPQRLDIRDAEMFERIERRLEAFAPGASVHPGGGVHGVSGTSAARLLLADLSGSGVLRHLKSR